MDGTRKTAILLLSLDQDAAAALLRKLPREQVERVTLAIANAENVTRAEQLRILTEFKLAFASRPLIQPAGPETARELLEKSLEQNEVEPTQIRIDEQVRAGPFAFLHNRHPDDLRQFIENEHSQTIAVITAHLPPDLAVRVLAGFPTDTQADIMARLARLGPADSTILEEIAELLRDRIGPIPVRTEALLHATDVLRETPRGTARKILDSIQQQEGELGNVLRESLFSFEEIESLNDAVLSLILEKTVECRWATALKGTSEKLRQRVLAALLVTMAKALTDAMNSVGPLRLSEITVAQAQIVDVILSLEADNEILLPKNSTRSRRLRRAGQDVNSESRQAELHGVII